MNTFYERADRLFPLSGKELQEKLEAFCPESGEAEKASWRKSLPKLLEVVQRAGLGNLYFTAEYELPTAERIDAILLGEGKGGQPVALIVELKQWSREGVEYTDSQEFPGIIVNAGKKYITRHPVVQTRDYVNALKRNHSNVVSGKLSVEACQYLHEFDASKKDFFRQGMYEGIDTGRMFFRGEKEKFADYLRNIFSSDTDGKAARELLLTGEYGMTEMDMEIIRQITESPDNIPLWQDQGRIMSDIRVLLKKQAEGSLKNRHLITISGAAGTGKTILGFRILAEYWEFHQNKGMNCSCVYTLPRSRTIKQVLDGLRGGIGISPVFLNNISNRSLELMVVDEAHRITELDDTGRILNRAGIVIILQDDFQRVLGNEIGTKRRYRQFASENHFVFAQYDLIYQKRSGFGSYVERVDRLLYQKLCSEKAEPGLEVRVCESLQELEGRMMDCHERTCSVKYYAPYCWEWKSLGNPAANDIEIMDGGHLFRKQWNPMYDQYGWYLDSIKQVGCIYTAQGLGFDYIGLIWWDDLVWRTDHWEIHMDRVTRYDSLLKKSMKNSSVDYGYLILNIYRVLLTRAKKGIYIWFRDAETREHFENFLVQ